MHYFWSLQRYPNHISSLYKAFWGPKVLHFKIKLEGRETDKKLGGLKLNFEHHRGTKTIFYPSENPWIKQKQKSVRENHKISERAKVSHINQYPPSIFKSKVHKSENQRSYYELKVRTCIINTFKKTVKCICNCSLY